MMEINVLLSFRSIILSLNNCDKSMNLFIRGMEVPIIEAVTNHITKDELKNIIEVILSDSQY